MGTTSDQDGAFSLPPLQDTVTIIISSLGYQDRKIEIRNIKDTIWLSLAPIELLEVNITPPLHNITQTVGHFKKRDIQATVWSWNKPWMMGRYYSMDSMFSKTPYLKSIKVFTDSYGKGSIFNIRLLSVDTNGFPGSPIYPKNIFVTSKKGRRLTKIDLSEFSIKIVDPHFFVVVEWLIIDSNKYEYTYTETDSNRKKDGISYQPALGMVSMESKLTWGYREGKWRLLEFNGKPNEFLNLAIELEFSN